MISVITITYNRKNLLKIAIGSVLAQSYEDFEYIIVDDGSDDGTKALVESYHDARIIYVLMAHTAHLSLTRNVGLEKARGEVIAFLDSDDYWDPAYLSTLDKIYKTENVKSVISNAFVFNSSGKSTLLHKKNLAFLKGRLLEQKFLNDAMVIYPSAFSFLRNTQIKFNENMKWGDNDCFLKVLNVGDSIIHLPELVYVRKHDSNMSEVKAYNTSFIQAYNEEFQTLDYLKGNKNISVWFYRKIYSKYLYKQSHNLLQLNMPAAAWMGYLRSFLKYPLHLRSLRKLFLFYKFFNASH